MVKEWTPYTAVEDGHFMIITDLEKERVIEYNPRINSLTKYKFADIKTAGEDYFHEYKDYKRVIRKIFELELLDTI